MRREASLPHLAAWAVAEARRLRVAAADTNADDVPPAASVALDGAHVSTKASPVELQALRPVPQSAAFLDEWQLEHR